MDQAIAHADDSSRLLIGSLRVAQYFLTKIGTEDSGRVEIRFSADQAAKLNLYSGETDQADPRAWLKFDQHVDIAVRGKVIA